MMNRCLAYFLLGCTLGLSVNLPAQVFDLEGLLAAYPERVARLFAGLDPGHPELGKVALMAEGGDYRGAGRALIDYFRGGDSFKDLRQPTVDRADLEAAQRLMADIFTFQNRTARQPRNGNGRLNWSYEGPAADVEWTYQLNRHEWFLTLLDAYHYTGDERYARQLNDLLVDWIISNPFPVEEDCCPPWRTLEAALRFRSWPAVFYGLQSSPSFSEAARLLMLISVMEHVSLIQRFHWTHQNHALFELNGLARIAAYWSEFQDAGRWFDYAARHMLYEMEGQVLPDGVQDELTSLYHYHALEQFRELMDLAGTAGRALPPAFRRGLEKMYDYLAFTQRPDGSSLLNNDSDRNDYRPDLVRAAEMFNRPDWDYIISNGREGQAPAKRSVIYPYAGQVIMRDGWEHGAQWSFFDGGPDGTAHRHYDKLHLSITAGGRDLLVDSGRYWYKSDIWREYFVSSYGHNVVLVDGFGHRPDEIRYETPDRVAFETTDRYTYVQASFDAGFREVDDPVRHTRGVLYLPGRLWIVIDRLEAAEPHTIQALWHFHPTCHVTTAGQETYSDDPGAGNLLIRPLGADPWRLDLRFGPDSLEQPDAYQEWKPRPFDAFPISGAYSARYNQKEAGYVAVYQGRLHSERTFAWLLIPFTGSDYPEKVLARLRTKGRKVVITARVRGDRLRAVVDMENNQVRMVEPGK